MPNHEKLRSAQPAPQAGLLPAAEIFSAPFPVYDLVAPPDERPEIPVNEYPFDTLPTPTDFNSRSLDEQLKTLPSPISIWRGMKYPLNWKSCYSLTAWTFPYSISGVKNITNEEECKKLLKSGFLTFPAAYEFNNTLAKMYARLKTLTSAEMQQSGHGEALNHVQRTASNTAASGPQQPTPVAQLDTQWTQIEHSLLKQISRVTHHSINIGDQMAEDLQRVVSQIDDFVRGAKSRFEEIQALVSKFSAAVENSKGNAPASAENSRAQSAQGTKIYQLLSERYILGFLRVLVPLFTNHPTMDTTEALLMLRIEGCKREWIPSLTRMLKVAFGGNPEAEWNQCEYLQRQPRIRGLWLCWQLVTSGNEWAIHAIADPTSILNGVSTSSLKVYLMPTGPEGKGWEVLSAIATPLDVYFDPGHIHRMAMELVMTCDSRLVKSGSGQQSGGYYGSSQNSSSPTAATTTPATTTPARATTPEATTAACKQSNHNHSSNYPSPYISSFQMNPMANTGNYCQQPQHFGNSYGFGYTPPQVPSPNGHNHNRPRTNSHDGPSGCGCGAKYGCGHASGSGSQKRVREDEYALPQTPQGPPLDPNRYLATPALTNFYGGSDENTPKGQPSTGYMFIPALTNGYSGSDENTPQGRPPLNVNLFTPAVTNGHGGGSGGNGSGPRKRQQTESDRQRMLKARR